MSYTSATCLLPSLYFTLFVYLDRTMHINVCCVQRMFRSRGHPLLITATLNHLPIYHTFPHSFATPLSQSPVSTTPAVIHHSQSLLQSPQYKYTCVLSIGLFDLLNYRPNMGCEYCACRSAISAVHCFQVFRPPPPQPPPSSILSLLPRFSLLYFCRNPGGQ